MSYHIDHSLGTTGAEVETAGLGANVLELFSAGRSAIDNMIPWIEQHPVIGTALLTLVAGIAWGVAYITVTFFRRIWRYYRDALTVVDVNSSESELFTEFLELYEELFDDDERIATREIIAWLEGKGAQCGLDYNLFVAKMNSQAIGIGIAMTDRETGLIYVPYLGLRVEANRWNVSKAATQQFLKRLTQRNKGWRFLIVELDDPDQRRDDRKAYDKSLARMRRLQEHCASLGLRMGFAPFQYIAPPYHSDVGDKDIMGMRLGIVQAEEQPMELDRVVIMEILEFVYRKVYLSSIWEKSERKEMHFSDIEELLSLYERKLPKKLGLLPTYVKGYEIEVI